MERLLGSRSVPGLGSFSESAGPGLSYLLGSWAPPDPPMAAWCRPREASPGPATGSGARPPGLLLSGSLFLEQVVGGGVFQNIFVR